MGAELKITGSGSLIAANLAQHAKTACGHRVKGCAQCQAAPLRRGLIEPMPLAVAKRAPHQVPEENEHNLR